MIPYPTFEDYLIAVGAPQHFFTDPEITRRVVAQARDRLGLPEQFSGRYAITFKFQIPGTTNSIAVRCFKQEISALLERYTAIDTFLRSLHSQFFVDFAVTAPAIGGSKGGVLVRGRWLPVVRMDWVEGQTLDVAVRERLLDTQGLGQLRSELLSYASLSERAGFAHGDIHPENVLMAPDRTLRLVDYDGMYVPGLARLGAAVAGQADYQSPIRMRSADLFGPWLDRFPLIVLDLSLAALQIRPDLIKRKTPGEGLLLGQADFEAPEKSTLLQDLEQLPGLANSVRVFRNACSCPLEQVPSLENFRHAEGTSGSPTCPLRELKRNWITGVLSARSALSRRMRTSYALLRWSWGWQSLEEFAWSLNRRRLLATVAAAAFASVLSVGIWQKMATVRVGVGIGLHDATVTYATVTPPKTWSGEFSVNLRTGPGTRFGKIRTVTEGTRVELLGHTTNGWTEVRTIPETGTSNSVIRGYISSKYLASN